MDFVKIIAPITLAALLCLNSCSKNPESADIRDDLQPKGKIMGLITDKQGNPIKSVIISINSDSATPGVSGQDGRFTVGNVLKGSYTLEFNHRDYEADTTYSVTVGQGQNVTLGDTVKLSYAYYILKGRVVYNSAPVPGVGVCIAATTLNTLTDADGSYTIDKIGKDAAIKILCAKSGFGFNSLNNVTAVSDDTTEVDDISLSLEGCTVSGTVYDTAGNPVSGAVVTAMGGGLADTSDILGQYTLTNFPSSEQNARIYITYRGFSGAISGIMGEDGSIISGADIRLHPRVAVQNGMGLVAGDVVVSDTAENVTLRVFRDDTTSTVITSYEWFYGDTSGTADTVTSNPVVSLPVWNFEDQYVGITDSLYPVFVRSVSFDGKLSATYGFTVRVRPMLPTVDISGRAVGSGSSATEDTVDALLADSVYFYAGITAPFGGIDSLIWNFGDNSGLMVITGSTAPISHIYRLPGNYTVVLAVKSLSGAVVRDTLHIAIPDSSITHSGTLTAPQTWYPRNNPHKVSGILYVNAPLTIMPGVYVQFLNNAELRVGSSSSGNSPALIAEGTVSDSIVFTSVNTLPQKGDWHGIAFYEYTVSTASNMTYCRVDYAASALYIDNSLPSISHCLLRNSSGYGVACVNSGGFTAFEDNVVTGNTGYPISIAADQVISLGQGNSYAGNTANGISVHNAGEAFAYVRTTGTWKNFGVPYVITDDLYLEGTTGPVLTIAPGCSLEFNSGFMLRVAGYSSSATGTLVADGTPDSQIVFTTSAATHSPGAWNGIAIEQYATATGNLLDNCIIEYATTGLTISFKPASVTNCTIRNNSNYGVSCAYVPFSTFDSNTVTGNTSYPLSIGADYVGGISQHNNFLGNTANGIRVHNDGETYAYVRTTGTWKNFGVPYVMTDDLYLESTTGPVLTIAPGCSLEFNTGLMLRVAGYSSSATGTLVADGTPDSQIVFTTSAATHSPGAWNGIAIEQYATATGNLLDNCIIEYATTGLTISFKPASVTNCTIRNNSNYGVSCAYVPFSTFDSNTVTGNTSYPLSIGADYVGGISQHNDFLGNTANGIRVHNDGETYAYVRTTGTWKNFGIPYVITDDLYLEGTTGPVLTIAPGCSLKFNTGFMLRVAGYSSSATGTLVANGTPDSQIVFTALAANPAPGAWTGISVEQYAAATGNLFNNCVIEYAVNGLAVDTKPASVTNCVIRNNSNYGVSCAYTAFLDFTGNTVTGNAGYGLTIGANGVGSLGEGNDCSGNTVPGIRVHGDGSTTTSRITTSATWLNHKTPYVMLNETRVGAAANVTLTIAPGCSLLFNSGIGLEIGNGSSAAENATLVAQGTVDSQIVFTSSSQSPAAGAWDGITLGNDINDANTIMDYCVVEYGGANAQANIYCTNSSPTISNCTVTNSSYYGIRAPAPGSSPVITKVTYLNNARGDFLDQ